MNVGHFTCLLGASPRQQKVEGSTPDSCEFFFPFLFLQIFFGYILQRHFFFPFHPPRNLFLSRNRHVNQRPFKSHHSRMKFINMVSFSVIEYSNSGSRRFKNKVSKYCNVRQLVTLESMFIGTPRMRKICLNLG